MVLHLNHIRHIIRINNMRLSYLCLFLAILYCSSAYSQVKNEDDLKKQADKNFEEEEYNEAYKQYAQLVSLYPKDPEYNYRLGVCMLFTEPDKKKPYSYFQIALKNPAEAPKDAKFYLAKTYHINYKFDEALKLYNEYKKTASAASAKKLQVDREIQACANGKRLLSNLSDLVIINKKQLNEADYFRSYDLKDIGGKLLVKSPEFQTSLDKKKKDKSVIYLPRSGDRIYYSSYGENGDRGRDIYYVNRLPNGSWSKPTLLPAAINTEYDEDYPFVHPNGKTLYFSSKGHNSMGGYDVFKTTFDEATNTWSKPVNLDFPISSPDDDILFVTDSLEKTAFFSTGRYSPYGKIDVLKINTERRPMNFAVLKGTVVKEEASQSLKSKITVKNMANGEIVGTYQAQDNGDYYMELPNGGKFIFTVETPGIPTQSDGVQIPVAYNLKPYKQVISYDQKKLKIINYFDGQVADDNYTMMIDLIEKKAKLEINEMDPYNNSLKDAAIKNQNENASNNNNGLNSVTTNNPTVTSDSGNPGNPKSNVNTNKNVTNEQLLNLAKDDAKEASEESAKLKQEAQDAFGLATQKTAEAVDKQKQADEALAAANSITDVAKKNEELSKANKLKEEATIASNVANTATNLAKKLEVDANQKQKEADLTNQYIKQLEEVIKNKNNKEALAKLEQIQKDLDELSNQKNQSDEILNSLKAEAELKQKELAASEKKTQGILNEIKAIKSEAEGLEKDMLAENDKALKENIAAQIRELNNEVELKNKELATNNQKIETLSNEVEGVNKELEIASKILNETNTTGVAVNNENTTGNGNEGTAINGNTNNNGSNAATVSAEGLNKKYNDQLNSAAIDKNTKEGIAKQTAILKTYTKEATDLIAIDKNALAKTTDTKEKNRLNTEIKALEKLKTDNEKLIAANNEKVKQLESSAIASNANNNAAENGNAITSNNGNNSTAGNSNAINNTNNNGSGNPNGTQINNTNSTAANTNTAGIAANNGNNAANTNTTAVSNTNSTAANTNSNGTNINNNNGNASAATNTATIANNNGNANNNTNGNAITNENPGNANGNTNSIANNATNGNENSNANSITGDNPNANTETLRAISTGSSNDKTTYLNELTNLKNSLDGSSNKANSIFAYDNYKEGTSLNLKQNVAQKFEAARQNEANLNNLIANIQSSIQSAAANNPATLVNEADALNNKAAEQRKESATKTGAEKEALITQAIANEKAAVAKKLEASVLQQKQNKNQFDNNTANLTELKTLTGSKTSNEISQANMLMDEAAINFKQAQKIRSETEFYPSDAAKLGGLSNAEEKENEALFKQQKALELLGKANPGFKPKTLDASNPASAIESLNAEIAKTSQSQLDAYLALSKANQNELKLQGDKVAANPAIKNGTNAQAKALKTESDNLNKEAKDLIGKSLTATNNAEKANLLLKANDKEIEAIKKLNEANDALKASTAIAANNPNNNGNNNAASTTTTSAANAGNNTGNNNQNSVAANNTNANGTNPDNNSNNAANNTNALNNENNAANNAGNNANNTTTRTTTASANNTNENAVASNTTSAVSTESPVAVNNQAEANNANTTSATVTGNGVGDEAAKLKAALNNNKEASISEFNAYTNNEAIALRNDALNKIKAALNEDKLLSTQLDNVNQLAGSQATGGAPTQASISNMIAEAEKLNDEAFAKRKAASTKTGAEKDKDLNDAKVLEQQAIAKKVDAAAKQEQLNSATFQANQQSLQELAEMAKGKNIAELSNAEKEVSDANLAFKQATDLRTEAKALPSDAAKLGGYSNAEEKENQAIAKQQALLDIYKKYFSNYVAKQPSVKTDSPEAINKLNETKASFNTNNQQHIEGLTLLSQANTKEYQSRVAALPANLTTSQTGSKTKAQNAYKKSQDLLNQANQTTDPVKKKNLLIDANQSAQEAITVLGQIAVPNSLAGNNPSRNNNAAANNTNNNAGNNNASNSTNTNQTASNNPNRNATNNNTANNAADNNNNAANNTATVRLKVEGLDIKTTNAYSAAKPIPIDEKMPDGLVFKVQIGAFKAPLPDNTFRGLSPVSAQTTPNGYLRYMAGNFEKYESASAVKNDLRNLGYNDAFVVAYLNGKRITLAEAIEKLKSEGKAVDLAVANTSAGLSTSNVPRNPFPAAANTTNTVADSQPADITKELEQTNGLLYTVQIGVYSKQATRAQLSGLRPIYTEKLPNGLYRYTAGIYNQGSKLLEDKRKVVDLGVKDAFVSAYYNSKRIPFAEGQKLQAENNNLKMEAENPIIFPGAAAIAPANNNTSTQPAANTGTGQPTVAAFSNGVATGPAPTAENGVKTDDAGISFKVQIGAYKNQVPNEVASKFLNIKTWPVNNVVINGLYIYTIGNFTGISFAKKLKDEAISLGITDAFITVYKDGKKLYGAEATQYLSN